MFIFKKKSNKQQMEPSKFVNKANGFYEQLITILLLLFCFNSQVFAVKDVLDYFDGHVDEVK